MKRRSSKRWPIRVVALSILTLGILAFIGWWQFGSPGNVLSFLCGNNCVVEPLVVDVGEGSKGEKLATSIDVRNLGFKSIRIVGVKTTCNCLTADELPMTILPRSVRQLHLSIYLHSSTQDVEQMVELMLDDHGRLRVIPIVIKGKILKAE